MDILTAIEDRRSIRLFQPKDVPEDVLKELIRLGRLYLSGANLQPVRFALISRPENRDAVFPMLKWAAYLPDFKIRPEQQPRAYIILLRDDTVKHSCQFDVGAAATTVCLAAKQFGLDSCCLASFNHEQLRSLLALPEAIVPELVIALGYADQCSQAVPFTGSVRYTANENWDFSVPKFSAAEVTVYSDL